jgi:hypothetical protein
MPYVNKPRPYKKEYAQQVARGELPDRMERQRAREAIDKKSADKNGNNIADKREGKDVAHVKALSKGGGNGDGAKDFAIGIDDMPLAFNFFSFGRKGFHFPDQ